MQTRLSNLFTREGILPVLGLTCALSWVYSVLLSPEPFYLAHHLGFGVGLLVVALYSALSAKAILGKRAGRWLDIIAAACMCLAPLRLVLPGTMTPEVLIPVGVITGMAIGYCLSRLFGIYCSFKPNAAINYTLLACIFSALMRFMLTALMDVSYAAVIIVICLLPFTIVFCNWNDPRIPHSDDAMETPHSEPEHKTGAQAFKALFSDNHYFGSFVWIIIEIAIFGLFFGFTHDAVTHWSDATTALILGHLLRAVVPLLFLIWFNAQSRNVRTATNLRWAVLGLAFLLLAAMFFGNLADSILPALILTARNVVTVIIYVMLFRITFETRIRPGVVFGIGRAVYELMLTLGLFLFSQPASQDMYYGLPANVLYFAIACIFLLMLDSFARMAHFLPSHGESERVKDSRPADSATLAGVCDAVRDHYRLSEREYDVLLLTCQAFSKKQIAEKMFLSENTIGFHTKQIYRKLDIHSKSELLNIVEQMGHEQ